MFRSTTDAADMRPLSQVPALVVAEARDDVRGWTVLASDHRPIGEVVDLLADIDRLIASHVVIATARAGEPSRDGGTVVPLAVLAPDEAHRRLVPGDGMPPIPLRYRSTARLAAWAAIIVMMLLIAGWALGAFAP